MDFTECEGRQLGLGLQVVPEKRVRQNKVLTVVCAFGLLDHWIELSITILLCLDRRVTFVKPRNRIPSEESTSPILRLNC